MIWFSVVIGALSLAALFLIYGGFIFVLRLAVFIRRMVGKPLFQTSWPSVDPADLPTVTIFIPALNEEGRIGPRMDNIAELDYPADKIEIIVASDGSTDNTAGEAQDWLNAHPAYKGQVKNFVENVGRATAQNWAAGVAAGEIFLNTDVETRFEPATLKEITKPFQDPSIGAVGVQTLYHVVDTTGVGDMYASYRAIEYAMREEETRLGLCAKSDGPCTAVRTALWTPIALFEDIDYAVPLMVKKAGQRLVYAPEAIAHDVANANPAQEFKQRSRMTIRQLTSFAFHWSLPLTFKFPAFTAVFVCHKILRMLSPFFLIGLLLAYLLFAFAVGKLVAAIILPLVLVAVLFALEKFSPKAAKFTKIIRSLVISNYAFAHGSIKAFMGQKVTGYKPTRSV